jgi:hypothetical protein
MMMTLFDQTPDRPQGIGFKTSWFAVKASDPASVLDALEFEKATPANWKSGVTATYSSERSEAWVFTSPPVDGWVLVVGSWLPYPVTIEANHDIGQRFDILFSRLMKRFDDVQFFGTHRGVGFVTWARALHGKPIRIFGFADADILANFGEQTAEEAKLKFANLTGLSPSNAADELFRIQGQLNDDEEVLITSGLSRREARARVRQKGRALLDETDVPKLAALWSIDPIALEDHDHPPGLGLAVRLPEDLTQ